VKRYRNAHRVWAAVAEARLERPLPHGFGGGRVEIGASRLKHVNRRDVAFGVDRHGKDDIGVSAGRDSRRRVLGIDVLEHHGAFDVRRAIALGASYRWRCAEHPQQAGSHEQGRRTKGRSHRAHLSYHGIPVQSNYV
jgi:hypothetical protein